MPSTTLKSLILPDLSHENCHAVNRLDLDHGAAGLGRLPIGAEVAPFVRD